MDVEGIAMTRRATRQKNSRPTIADVARHCGLSKGTVSKALNIPAEQCPVREATRERVMQAAKDLGYRPSWLARALAKQKTHTVGLLYARLMPPVVGIYERLIVILAASLQHRGYHLVLVSLADSDEAGQMVLDQRVDGCVVIEEITPGIEAVLREAEVPVALVNLQTDLPGLKVLVDDHGGGRMVTEHLLGLGHRRVVFLDPTEKELAHFSHGQRVAGYEQAMRDAGLGGQARLVKSPVAAFAAETARSAERATGVIVYSHLEAIALMQALWRHGLRVPQDISVATFNDVPVTELTIPPLTTVAVPTREMGHQAGCRLVEEIEGRHEDEDDGEASQTIVLPETLVVRESTAPPPA